MIADLSSENRCKTLSHEGTKGLPLKWILSGQKTGHVRDMWVTFTFQESIQCQEDVVAFCRHLEQTTADQDLAPAGWWEHKNCCRAGKHFRTISSYTMLPQTRLMDTSFWSIGLWKKVECNIDIWLFINGNSQYVSNQLLNYTSSSFQQVLLALVNFPQRRETRNYSYFDQIVKK